MIHHAMKHNLIHDGAFGSVPGRTAHGAILHKLLKIEHMRMERKPGILFECDATGCYDRIILSLQTVHTRRLGLRKEVSTVIVGSLQHSKRHISTKFGVSDRYITSTPTEKLYGIVQGSGSGPAL